VRETSARQVHTALAAAMADPELLDRWRHDREAHTATGIDGADLEAVWRFAGLATKVRQGDVRISLPVTFRLLDWLGLSIDVFSEYAVHVSALRKAGKRSKAERVHALVDFLDGWLDRTQPAHARVWDMLRHECAIFDLQSGAASAAGRAGPGDERVRDGPVCAKAVLLHPLLAVHHEMSCDPLELARLVCASRRDFAEPRETPMYFAYRWDSDGHQVRVLRLDDTTYALLTLVDGDRTVAELAGELRDLGVPVDIDELTDAFQSLVDAGLLALDANRSGDPCA
jgi:hypothetical protein